MLLHINDWDVRWQHYYQFVRPVTLPAGTRVSMRFTFDNSSENPRNPLLPPQRVFWGEESTSEMGELWVQLLTEDDRQLRMLNAAIQPKMAAEDAVGYETRLRQDPARVQLHDEAGDVYLYLGRPADAIRHFTASLDRRPDSAAAHPRGRDRHRHRRPAAPADPGPDHGVSGVPGARFPAPVGLHSGGKGETVSL